MSTRYHRLRRALEHHGPGLPDDAGGSRVKDGTLKPGATSLTAGRLGSVEIKGDNILLGQPYLFTKDNIDRFDF